MPRESTFMTHTLAPGAFRDAAEGNLEDSAVLLDCRLPLKPHDFRQHHPERVDRDQHHIQHDAAKRYTVCVSRRQGESPPMLPALYHSHSAAVTTARERQDVLRITRLDMVYFLYHGF